MPRTELTPLAICEATALPEVPEVPEADCEPATPKRRGPPALALATFDALGIEAICRIISEGGGIRDVAAAAGASHGSFLEWLSRNPDHSARVREARRLTAWHWDEQAEHAIRDAPRDPIELARARELAFHFRWRAGKLNQAIYGERAAVDVSGEVVHTTPEQRRARIVALQRKLGYEVVTIEGVAERSPNGSVGAHE